MTGYSPTAFLPIWLPHSDDFYSRHQYDVQLADAGANEALITVLNAENSPEAEDLLNVYAPNGGTLSILLDANAYGHPGKPAFVFTLTPIDQGFMQGNLPGGIPPASTWIFIGANMTSNLADMDTLIKAIPFDVKKNEWDHNPNSLPDLLSVDENYSYLFSNGYISCALKPGDVFSQLSPNGDGTFSLSLRVLDLNGSSMSPFPLIASYYRVNNDLAIHPLIDLASHVLVDTEIYLQFRYWDVTNTTDTPKGSWSFLPNSTVEVIDSNSNYDIVQATATTDTLGKVNFTLPNNFLSGNDLYFRVTVTQEIKIQFEREEKWTGTWTTSGLTSIDGQPGYYENFSGYSIGRPETPVVFNVGVPVFLQLYYYHGLQKKQRPVAKGTQVKIKTIDYSTIDLDFFYADKDGEIWGTAFQIVGGGYNELEHTFLIEDSTIKLPAASFAHAPATDPLAGFVIPGWSSSLDPVNGFVESKFSASMIGDPTKLKKILVDQQFELQAAALFIMKVIRDTHQWFYYLSNKLWGGVEGLLFYINGIWPVNSSVTPPNLGILYDLSHIWNRSVIAHEYSHAVTWEYIPYSSVLGYEPSGLLWKVATGAYIAQHNFNIITNGVTAFMDGWSLMVQLALSLDLPWDPQKTGNILLFDMTTKTWVAIDSTPQLGLTTEGCYAQAMWDYLNKDVGLQPTPDTDESDLSTVNPSLVDLNIQTKFQHAVWFPMVALAENNLWENPNEVVVADFLARVKSIMPPSDYTTFEKQLITWHLE